MRLRFTGSLAEMKRKKFRYRKEHWSQQLEERNGDLIVTYRVRNPGNMRQWVMQYGSAVEVLGPDSLQKGNRQDEKDNVMA